MPKGTIPSIPGPPPDTYRNRKLATLATALLLCAFSASASAHLIHPFKNKTTQGAETLAGLLSQDVHEELTQLARTCSNQHRGKVMPRLVCPANIERSTNPDGNIKDSLVRGVWWNDDPNQLLFKLRAAKFLAWMKDAESIAKNGKGRSLNATYNMTYRGHYGDLQFLHGMATRDGERPEVTRDAILAFSRFAYEVATGSQDLETKMNQVSPPELRRYFDNQSGWTINYLFAPKYRLKGASHIRQMAAGSLLHMIQDSYSESHTTRSLSQSGACPEGGIVEFHSYVNQDADAHKRLDLREAWKNAAFSDSQDPLNTSATILHFIDRKADWTEVHRYLDSVVFCLVPNSRPASPGTIRDSQATFSGKSPHEP